MSTPPPLSLSLSPHLFPIPTQRVSKEPQSTPATKGPPGKIPEAVPAKKAINQSVNMNTYSPSLGYDKDINPYAKSAAASALDAVGETL